MCHLQTEDVPTDFQKSVIFALPKKAKAHQCENFRTISVTSHASKVLTRIIYRRIENRIEELLEGDQFGFRKSRGTREAILTLRLIIEGRIKKNQDTYMAFVDLEKAFDNVKWTKMFEILKKIGLNYRERRLIYNIYKQQQGLIKIEGHERQAAIKKGVRQGCSLSPILFNIYVEEAIKEVKDKYRTGVKIQGKRIPMIRFADDIAMLAETKEDLEEMLNGMNNLLSEEFGLRINSSKTKVMRSSKNEVKDQMKIRIGNSIVEEVKQFCYLGSKITQDGRSKEDIKSRIAQGKKSFYNKRDLLVSNIDLGLRKKLMKLYVWSTALYGCETWTLGKPEKKRLEAFEMWCYRRMMKIKWTDMIRNEEVLTMVGEQKSLWKTLVRRRDRLVGHVLRHPSLVSLVMEGLVEGKNGRGRQRLQYATQIVEDVGCKKYVEMKRLAQDRRKWRTASNQSKD